MKATHYYTLRDQYDVQDVFCCDEHAKAMPAVDGERVRSAAPNEWDHGEIECEFCEQETS